MAHAPAPPGLTAAARDRALTAFAGVVGAQWLLATEEDRHTYLDAYALGDGLEHVSSAAVAPASVAEVQAILRIANEHRIPLWPTARGKNLGYGGSAPLVAGSVVLDLGRMNRILDVDAKLGHCLLEPGVSFYDLHAYLQEHKIPLWMSVPGNGWGSVMGNALERGIGYTPYGDNTSQMCGLEIVLPKGDLVRTGMGAMTDNAAWQCYQHGFGPSWDQMFTQSNFGIVTKMGFWLMPEPEMTMRLKVALPNPEDIGWAIDALHRLRLDRVIEHNFVFGNYLRDAASTSQRVDWYDGPGAFPQSAAEKVMKHFGIGWWNFSLGLYGHDGVVKAREAIVRKALEPHLDAPLVAEPWHRGEPIEKSLAGRPSVAALQVVNWYGGRGGHVGFSPVMPPDGRLALEQFKRMKARYDEYGQDYYTSFTMGQRHINNVNLILYNRDDRAIMDRVKRLFPVLIADTRAHGYAEYRTHLDYMQTVAESFDFNDGAMARLNRRVKDALDPNGILAPGKNGIWPTAHRAHRA